MITMSSCKIQKNDGLSVLRGIFILMIVFHHMDLYAGGGTLGVSFFFVLGGFSLSLGYYDIVCSPSFSYLSFVKRRCMKFFPLHWFTLMLVFPLALFPLVIGTVAWWKVLAPLIPNALLLQSLIPISSVYFSFNAVSWYLSATLIFSFLFPFIVRFMNRWEIRGKILLLVVIVSLYGALVYCLPIESRHAILYINPLIRSIDFFLGILLYVIYRDSVLHHINSWQKDGYVYECIGIFCIIFLIGISVVSSENMRLISAIYWIPVAVLILSTMLNSNAVSIQIGGGKKIRHVLLEIGELSFPIFLVHQVVIRYSNLLFRFCGFDCAPIKNIVLIILIFTASWLCNQYYLRPVLLWLKERKI